MQRKCISNGEARTDFKGDDGQRGLGGSEKDEG